jgi:hypothetical protein
VNGETIPMKSLNDGVAEFALVFQSGVNMPKTKKAINLGGLFGDLLKKLVEKCFINTEEKAMKKLALYAKKMRSRERKDKDLDPPKWAAEVFEKHGLTSDAQQTDTWRGAIMQATANAPETARMMVQAANDRDRAQDAPPPEDTKGESAEEVGGDGEE